MNKKKLIELFIYISIVVIGIIFLITSQNCKRALLGNISGQVSLCCTDVFASNKSSGFIYRAVKEYKV